MNPSMTLSQWLQTAMGHHQRGQFADAERIYRAILARNPNQPDALHLLGVLAAQTNHPEQAVELIERAIAIKPDLAPFHCNLGNALAETGRRDDAVRVYRRAIELDPGYFSAHYALGNVLDSLGRTDESIAAHQQALALNPSSGQTLNNLGIALCAAGRWDESAEALTQAANLLPESASVHTNLAMLDVHRGRVEEGIAEYDRALALEKPRPDRASSRIGAMHYDPRFGPEDLLQAAKQFDGWFGRASDAALVHENDRNPARKLRIGYVSADFRAHVVGRCMAPVLKHHDREQFEVHCYSAVVNDDAVTDTLRKLTDAWHPIHRMEDAALAQKIRTDRIDVLIDLAAHTQGNRLQVFARRPAPVQMTWLGCCTTTGLTAMDRRISDAGCDPEATDLSVYSERTLRVPGVHFTYLPPREAPDVSAAPAASGHPITFGCMNNFTKCSLAAMDLWIQIMRHVPGSHLILHSAPGKHRDRALNRFESAGISPQRLEFVAKVGAEEYFNTYRRIDIALDPTPYSGAITSCDTLWMGVPMISLSGRTAVGRMGRAILQSVGLPELVAQSPDDYVRLATDLARDIDRIQSLRRDLRERMRNSPLMKPLDLVRNLEALYRQTWIEFVSAQSSTPS